jgi:hypothetical protein
VCRPGTFHPQRRRPHLDDIAPDTVLELFRRAGVDDPAVVDDDHLAGQLVGLLQVLGGEQHVGALGHQASDRVPQGHPAARVQPGRRLVEQQEPGSADQAGAQVEAPAHPARVRADEPAARVGQAEAIQDGGRRPARRPPIEPEQAGHKLQVLRAGHGRLHRRVLAGQADHLADAAGLGRGVDARHPKHALVGTQQGGDRAHEGGLAGAVRSQEGGHPPRLGHQVEPVQGPHVAEALGEAYGLDGGGHGIAPPCRGRVEVSDIEGRTSEATGR